MCILWKCLTSSDPCAPCASWQPFPAIPPCSMHAARKPYTKHSQTHTHTYWNTLWHCNNVISVKTIKLSVFSLYVLNITVDFTVTRCTLIYQNRSVDYMGWYYRGNEKSLDKNCDREVQLRICAGRLFHAVGADIENEQALYNVK